MNVAQYRGRPWIVLTVVSLGFFMVLLDLTIVNIAIPNMIAKLPNASLDGILWVINAYALVLAVLLITAGRLGDIFGQRITFIIGIVAFTAASAACGLAPTVGWLIAFRAIQGVGAALLMPQTLAILTMVFPPERRGAAFGVWGAVAGVATIAGPTLGGLLVTAYDWRYIFFLNIPIGVVVIVLSWLLIPDLKTGQRHRLDMPGVILASLALLAICYGLVEGQRYNWGTVTGIVSIPLIIGVGVVLLGIFLVVQRYTQDREPLVPFALFKARNFGLMNWVSGAVAIGMMGIFLPLTIYLQSALGFSALKAGLTMAPASAVAMFVAPVAGRLTDRIGGKYILLTGLTCFAGGMAWTVAIASTTSTWQDFLPSLAVAGFGMGCVFAPMTTMALRSVEPRMAGAASGMLNTVRQVGAVIGTAAVGALLQNRIAADLPPQAAKAAAALPAAVRSRFIAGFSHAASNGAALGTGQGQKAPKGTPPGIAAELGRISHDVFAQGFVTAMHATIIMPIAVIGIAAVSCLAIRQVVRPAAAARAASAGPAAGAGVPANGARADTAGGPAGAGPAHASEDAAADPAGAGSAHAGAAAVSAGHGGTEPEATRAPG